MRQVVQSWLVMVIVIVLTGNGFGGIYSGGNGDPGTPYLIADANDILEMSETTNDWSLHFLMIADVNMVDHTFTKAVIAWDANDSVWGFQGTPFTGIFDGNGHTISNLTICDTTNGHVGWFNYAGLFGYVGSGGRVSNLGVENVYIITAGENVGGLAAINDRGSITSCYATGSVTGCTYTGGLVGINNYASITSCYATSSVMGYSWYVGGLVGVNYNASITSSYAAGSIIGCSYSGGLVGWSSGPLISCFWDTETSCMADGVGNMEPDPIDVTGKTTAEMKTLLTFTSAGWDFVDESTDGTNDIWRMCVDGINYPHLFHQYNVNGDFACPDGVGIDDVLSLGNNWLNSKQLDTGFSYPCDPTFDGVTNLSDYVVLTEHWLEE